MEVKQNTAEEENMPEWVRPNLVNEKGELERTMRDFLGEEVTSGNLNRFMNILNNSPIIELSDIDWEVLDNTDSFHNVHPGQIEEERKLAGEYGRNFENILNAFKQGRNMECPIIVKNKEGQLHLVSGNTRLMIARALAIRPKVIVGEDS